MDELPTFAVDFPEAQQLGDLASILQDLNFVDAALDRLWKLLNERSEDRVQAESLWTAALITYYRCFASGKRFGLTDDLFGDLRGGKKFHQHYKNLRDKHIAHSVNPFEQISVGIALSNSPEGREAPVGVATLSLKQVCAATGDVLDLRRLTLYARKHVLNQAKQAEQTVLEVASSKTADELRSGKSLRVSAPAPELAGQPRTFAGLSTPDEHPALPSILDLMKLPLRAMVALASRCARRAQAQFDDPHGLDIETVLAHRTTVNQAIEFVEATTRTNQAEFGNLRDAAMEHREALAGPMKDDERQQNAAVVAYHAVIAVIRLIGISSDDTCDAAVGNLCANAVAPAVMASAGHPAAMKAINSDFARLFGLAAETGGTFPELGEVVDASENGPVGQLWQGD